jgi:hypothetical protein
VSSFTITFPTVKWPFSLTLIWDALAAVSNLDILTAISFDCMADSFTFYDTFLFMIVMPPAVLATIAAFTFVGAQCGGDEEEAQAARGLGWKIALVFLFLIYPSGKLQTGQGHRDEPEIARRGSLS